MEFRDTACCRPALYGMELPEEFRPPCRKYPVARVALHYLIPQVGRPPAGRFQPSSIVASTSLSFHSKMGSRLCCLTKAIPSRLTGATGHAGIVPAVRESWPSNTSGTPLPQSMDSSLATWSNSPLVHQAPSPKWDCRDQLQQLSLPVGSRLSRHRIDPLLYHQQTRLKTPTMLRTRLNRTLPIRQWRRPKRASLVFWGNQTRRPLGPHLFGRSPKDGEWDYCKGVVSLHLNAI